MQQERDPQTGPAQTYPESQASVIGSEDNRRWEVCVRSHGALIHVHTIQVVGLPPGPASPELFLHPTPLMQIQNELLVLSQFNLFKLGLHGSWDMALHSP